MHDAQMLNEMLYMIRKLERERRLERMKKSAATRKKRKGAKR